MLEQTSVLSWEKPKKTRSKDQWADIGFEDGPTGGYVPNMSDEDASKWKAKLIGHTTGFPQVEIRKSFNGVQMTVIVNLGGGYTYKGHKAQDAAFFGKKPEDFPNPHYPQWGSPYRYTQSEINKRSHPTKGINVHMALNGGATMTFDDMNSMHAAVMEAKAFLEALPKREK